MWCHRPGPQDILYVVLPYFNYCGFKRRQELFIKFVHEIQNVKGVRIVVSELVGPAPLPKLPVWKHIKNRSDSPVWMKEKLVNVGIKNLPEDSLTAEERMNLHLEKMKELENELNRLEEQKKILYDRYIQSRKAFKDYKPQTKKPKTRIDEIEIIIKPLNLELNMELAAREYDGCKLALTRTKRSLKLEKLFKSF